MRIRYHVAAREDVLEILEYYKQEGCHRLASAFFSDLHRSIKQIASRPRSFALTRTNVRRCNLNRFPHHVNFEIVDDKSVKILVVKHHQRDPHYGMDRR